MNDSPSKILVVGDVHGDLDFLRAVAKRAQTEGVATLLQLGDFGAFWPGSDRWLGQVEQILVEHQIDHLVFIDGNHEGWVSDVKPGGLQGARFYAPRSAEGLVRLTLRISWADRGCRWSWDGVRFGALGGAFSIDHRFRSAGRDWWPEHEAPSDEDVGALGEDPLDVLVTHEAPLVNPLVQNARRINAADELRSKEARQLVSRALANTGAPLLLHGHWHRRVSYPTNWRDVAGEERIAQVEALASNMSTVGEATMLLELDRVPRNPG